MLLNAGYATETDETSRVIERWGTAPVTACEDGNSVAYLRSSGQMRDFDFIVSHVDDLDSRLPDHGERDRRPLAPAKCDACSLTTWSP